MNATKILVADDEPNILMLTGVLFKSMGFEVISATNGEDAIQKAIAEKPDIIVTDVIMPYKDGFEVCRTVRNTPEIADTPIIILSAMGDEYNKITGFEGGADDYVTKPFNVEELKARVKALLLRYRSHSSTPKLETPVIKAPDSSDSDVFIELISTGIPELDECLYGGVPKGSNILVLGNLGKGKSSFSRKFVSEGLKNGDRCLMVAIDDNPKQIRRQISVESGQSVEEAEKIGLIRFVDAYSWTSFTQSQDEPFAVNGILELNQLSGVISDAGFELGHTVQNKLGGRRVLDSISSLLVNFELPSVQRFISQIARTAIAFGGVTTLFIMEEGTVTEQVLNNIKYIMDGVIEFGEVDGRRAVRITSMKWTKYMNKWTFLGE